MARRTFQELLALDRALIGTWSQIAAEECVDMIGAAGLDFTIVDCEHGAFGIERAERLFRAADANGLVPLVRAPSADRIFIGQALDAGAAGVVVPGIESAEQLRAMVAATRYAPDGTRGACPMVRAAGHFARHWPTHVSAQRAGTGILPLVETAKGVAAIDEICAVDGLLALVFGPFDLSVSMGHAGNYLHPDVQGAIDRMLEAAARHRLPVMAPVFNPEPAEARRQRDHWATQGVRIFVVGSDKVMLADAMARYAAVLR